jgi:photosystem II stability/assembly factor-like uncharacterized protein
MKGWTKYVQLKGVKMMRVFIIAEGLALLLTVAPTVRAGWHVVPAPCPGVLNDVDFKTPDDGWICGDGGLLLRYSEDGWERYEHNLTTADLHAVSLIKSYQNFGWAGGDGGTMLEFRDHPSSGVSPWEKVATPNATDIYTIHYLWADGYWAAGKYSHHQIWSGGFEPWEAERTTFDETVYGIVRPGAGSPWRVWAVGENGLIAVPNLGYFRWEKYPSPTRQTLRAVDFDWYYFGYACGDRGTILCYGANEWEIKPSPVKCDLYDVDVISTEDAWIVGAGNTILHYRGGQWFQVHSPAPPGTVLKAVCFISPEEGWAVGNCGSTPIILHYLVSPSVRPTSLGRIKALF